MDFYDRPTNESGWTDRRTNPDPITYISRLAVTRSRSIKREHPVASATAARERSG